MTDDLHTNQAPVEDSLRTRIAAAIDRRYNDEAIGHTYEVCLHAADAVIRELELSIEHHKTYTGGDLRYLTIEGHFNEPIPSMRSDDV